MQLRHIHLRNPLFPPPPPNIVHIFHIFLVSPVVLVKHQGNWKVFFASVGCMLPSVQGHMSIWEIPFPPPSLPPLQYCPNFRHIHGTVSVTCSCVHIVFLASLVVLVKPRVKWIIFFASVGPTLPLVQGHIFIFFPTAPQYFQHVPHDHGTVSVTCFCLTFSLLYVSCGSCQTVLSKFYTSLWNSFCNFFLCRKWLLCVSCDSCQTQLVLTDPFLPVQFCSYL